MDELIYTITLSDDTVINNLRLNGNNFISETAITEDMFEGNLGTVTISDNAGHSETHSNMELVQITETNGEYWFILNDISSETLEKMKLQADLEYVAMMTGVDL